MPTVDEDPNSGHPGKFSRSQRGGECLVHREVEPVVPPQVSYGLTALGKGITGSLVGLTGWIRDNAAAILAAQAAYDASR